MHDMKLYYHIASDADQQPKASLLEALKRIGAKPLSERKSGANDESWAIVHSADDSGSVNKVGLTLVVMISGAFDAECMLDARSLNSLQWKAKDATVTNRLDELVEYVERAEKDGRLDRNLNPSKWSVPRHTLIALRILCQAYQFGHDRGGASCLSQDQVLKTESIEWWGSCLGVDSTQALVKNLKKEGVTVKVIRCITRASKAYQKAPDSTQRNSVFQQLAQTLEGKTQ